MKRRFVLADPSMSTLGGHYLEYLDRVLGAAEAAGFTPIVGCNAALDQAGASNVRWPVHAVFQFDIWGHKPSARFSPLEPSTPESRAAWRRRFSHGGYYWALSNEPHTAAHYLSRGGMADGGARRLEQALRLRRIVRALEAADPDDGQDRDFAAREAAEIAHIRRGLDLMKAFPDSAPPLPEPIDPHMRRIRRAAFAARDFKKGLSTICTREGLGRDDIVFLPTMAWHDLHGLELFLRACRDSDALPQIASVFRRDLFRDYPDTHKRQDYAVHEVRALFARVTELAAKTYFFADTEELQDHYTQVTPSVGVLPVPSPIFPPPRRDASDDQPIVLGYLGDAREEKGFGLLPDLIGDLLSNPGERPIKLLAQAYTPRGANDVRMFTAIEKLRLRTPSPVTLAEGALGTRDYAELINGMDAILVPYDRGNYIARSSGVFMEAVCARRPTIVTAGTWMARIIDSHSLAYHQGAIPQQSISAQVGAAGLDWAQFKDGCEVPIALSENGGVSIHTARWRHTVVRRGSSTHFWLTFRHNGAGKDLFTQVLVAQRDRDERAISETIYCLGGRHDQPNSLVIAFEPDARDVWLSFGGAHSEAEYELVDLSVKLVKTEKKIARACGGLTFNLGEAGIENLAKACREMARDFATISESAHYLSDRIGPMNTPEALVASLQAQLNGVRTTQAVA